MMVQMLTSFGTVRHSWLKTRLPQGNIQTGPGCRKGENQRGLVPTIRGALELCDETDTLIKFQTNNNKK